jgi:anion-transporting  ArsA/GET3 family ATPase
MAGVLEDLFARRVLFVTGKGGVGKSSIAAALALLANDRGMRVLLVDVDAKGDAARFIDAGPALYRTKEAYPGLSYMAIHADEALDEYLRLGLKLPRMYRMGPLSRVFDFIATAAPGVEEVLIAGKIGFEERAREGGRPRWDLIVVDAAPSGQVLSHLRGPRTITELVKVGLIRNQTEWVREILEDPRRTGLVVVSLPEEMPVSETEELIERTPKEVDTPVLAVVANRVVRGPSHPEVLAALAREETAVSGVVGAPIGPAIAASELFARIADSQAPFFERLRNLGLPMLEVPYTPVGRHTLQATRRVARALEDG